MIFQTLLHSLAPCSHASLASDGQMAFADCTHRSGFLPPGAQERRL